MNDYQEDYSDFSEPEFEFKKSEPVPDENGFYYSTCKSKFTIFKGLTGYKNNSDKKDPKVKALYYCKSIVKHNERIILSWDGKNGRQWFIVPEDRLLELVGKNFHLYETLYEGLGNVFFDIEIKPTDKTFEEEITIAKNIILLMFPNAKFQISGNETEDKFSFHIVLSNYVYSDYSKYIIKMRAFCKCYEGFDESVYSTIRYMKCINQSKGYSKKVVDNRVQQYIEGDANRLTKHLITVDFDENYMKFEDVNFSDYLIIDKEQDITPKKRLERLEKRKQGIDISNIKPCNMILPIDFSYFNASPIDKLKVLPIFTRVQNDKKKKLKETPLIHDIVIRVMWWCKRNQISFDDFWSWNSLKDNSEERKERYTGYWNEKEYFVDQKYIDTLLELYYPKIKSKYPLHRYKRYIGGVDSLITKTLPLKTYLECSDISEDTKTTILAVGCGVGKTEVSIKYIKKHPELSYLVIVPRITLAYDIQERFKKAGITIFNYKSNEGWECQSNGVKYFSSSCQIISASSLHKLINPTNPELSRKYDIIICDEFETMIDQFLAPKIHGKNGELLFTNWKKFKSLLVDAKKILLLDAITTCKTINFVNNMNIGTYNLISNEKSMERSIIRLTKNRDEFKIDTERRFFNLILNDLKNGLKCFVFINYKTGRKEHTNDSSICIRGVIPLTQYICDKLKFEDDKDIIGYYAENFEAKQKLKYVNDTWKNVKCIITNTTNCVGINYELLDFDKVYIYYDDSVNPRDVIQVSKRVRHLKNNQMILYAEPSSKMLITPNILVESDDPIFKQLKKDVLLERECYSLDSLYYLCERNSISIDTTKIVEPLGESLITFEETDDYCIRYENLRDITEKEYFELKTLYEGGKINYYQKLEVEKFIFKIDNNRLQPTEKDMSFMWSFRFYIEKFNDLFTNPEYIINEFLYKNDTSLKRFKDFKINGKIPYDFDLKQFKFIENFRFKKIEKNMGQDTYVKIITGYFGPAVMTLNKEIPTINIDGKKFKNYRTCDTFKEVLKFYKLHNWKAQDLPQNNVCIL